MSRTRLLFPIIPLAVFALTSLSYPLLHAQDLNEDDPDPAAQAAHLERVEQEPANLGLGLRDLLARRGEAQRSAPKIPVATSELRRIFAHNDHLQSDTKGRVLVNINLDGSQTLAQTRAEIEAAGGEVTAEIPWYRKGLISAWLPLEKTKTFAGAKGIRTVHLAPRPIPRIGATTSQGATVHKTTAVNNSGYLGSGVTVGVLSDSYNNDAYDANDPGFTTPLDDVLSGDLPGTGNPNGYTTPVNVVHEDDPKYSSYDTDEGRAMLQIVHDLAPAAHLAFSTSGQTKADFANNIVDLYDVSGCQVMCDDIGFPDEPMFSDGVVAQAVDTVHNAGVTYFSAAGNDGNSGYSGDFAPVANAQAKARAADAGIQLSTIPPGEMKYIAEWHSFGTDAKNRPVVVQNIRTVDRTEMVFQWDDPFDLVENGMNGVTTDYDLLVFNAAGVFLNSRSGLDINTSHSTNPKASTNEPLEIPPRDLSAKTNYKICIVRMTSDNGSGLHPATHLRYVANANDPITGDYITSSSITTYGHPCAAGAIGVSAYNYDISPDPTDTAHLFTPAVESYSSNGPVTIYFDSAGHRLTTPSDRQQPALSAVDNVDTSFFPPSPKVPNPYDYEDDGFPNFSGTSAAAPHAAAVAALILNAAASNNLATPSPAKVLSLMTSTTQGQADQDPGFCAGTAGPVTVSATGDSATARKFFQINFNGNPGEKLTSLTLDLSPSALHFDPTKKEGFPFTVSTRTGSPKPKVIGKPVYSGGPSGKSAITLQFKDFAPGDTLSFGIDRDNDSTNMYGNSADSLAGSNISATVNGSTVSNGAFANALSKAYNFKAGYGLIDAQAAINALLAP